MSSDNGIYIFRFADQTRVVEMAAFDNMYWSFGPNNATEDINPLRVVQHIGVCPLKAIFYGHDKNLQASIYAEQLLDDMARDGVPCEYGVATINNFQDKTWEEVVQMAVPLAMAEAKYLAEMDDEEFLIWEGDFFWLTSFIDNHSFPPARIKDCSKHE